MYLLKKWWVKYERFWISGQGEDINYLLKKEIIYRGFFPESRNAINAIRNFMYGFIILAREKPTLIASFGAGIAPPIFLAAKLLRIPFVFVDSISFVQYPSLSARIAAFFRGVVLVQHEHMTRVVSGAHYWGSVI